MKLKLSKAYSERGADMGRPNVLPSDPDIANPKLYLRRLKLNGDYDEGGAYWGYTQSTAIYCAALDGYEDFAEDINIRVFVRAFNRTHAKMQIKNKLPNARFYS